MEFSDSDNLTIMKSEIYFGVGSVPVSRKLGKIWSALQHRYW